MGLRLSLVCVIGFALIHLTSRNLKFLKVQPRSRFLSVAGGITVSYVFILLLPKLGDYQKEKKKKVHGFNFLENHIYIVAMLGLALFYGLEQLAKNSKRNNVEDGEHRATAGVFWVHIGSFALFNATIGYLLLRGKYHTEWGMIFYFIAMSVQFIINDNGLRVIHKEHYDRYGRWLLAVSITIGWIIGVFTEVNVLILSVLSSFLAGGVILNVLKEELPEERESSFLAFFIGLIGYSILLLLL